MQDWLSSAAVHQDYLLFLVWLAWGAAGVFWWQSARHDETWRWLPWAAGAGMVWAGISLFSLTDPAPPLPGIVPNLLFFDRLHGCATALMLAGWFWTIADHSRPRIALRMPVVVCLVAVAAMRWVAPALGSAALAGAATVFLLTRPRWPLALAVLAVWFSSHGPVADIVQQSERWTGLGPWGLLWGGAHLVAAGAIATTLARRAQPATDSAARAELRALVLAGGLWLLAGFALAAWMGRIARANFEQSALGRAVSASGFIPRPALVELLDGNFRLNKVITATQSSGRVTVHGRIEKLDTPAGLAVRRDLMAMENAHADVDFVCLSTLRDGWVVLVNSQKQPRSSAQAAGLLRHETAVDLEDWAAQTPRYLPPHVTTYGMLTYARAPLVHEGRMLGWLVFRFATAAWSASQVQARLLVFVIVALGLGLAVLVALQRRRVRERESARAAATAAAAADQLKTAFLAKVSHELRTPIQSILGYSELLRSILPDTVARNRLAALRQHGELMLRLVNDLLDLSAIQAGAFRLNAKPVALTELVRQTVDSLRSRAEAKELTFTCEVDRSVPEWASIDGERLRQVVINLVANAIKFTDSGYVAVVLAPGAAPEEVKLIVSDTGPGIPAAERARLFQPFSRLEATAAKEGTGLGLSLAAALCRSMRGDIAVTSAPGEGACFTATFRAPPCAPQHAIVRDRGGALQGQRILVADDNALVRELFIAFFQDEGATCVAVPDGEAALTAAAAERFDAVVLDLGMPRLDGAETARRLRLQNSKQLRIVGVSAHAGAHERDRALAAGMNDFLLKPVELAALAAALTHNGMTVSRSLSDELMARLAAQFRAEAATQRAAVAAAIAEGDAAAVRAAAHYLKNSAAIVRDEKLFLACTALEHAAELGHHTEVPSAWTACEAALRPWLANPEFTGIPPVPSANHPSILNHA